jgi:hypothetical protein
VAASDFRPSIFVRVAMLMSSYAPLLVLMAVLGTWPSWWIRGTFLALAVIGVGVIWVFLRYVTTRRNPLPYTVYQAKPREGEALKFFASYVVPFFVAITAPTAARWGLLVYLSLLALLYLRGDLYFTNPLIALYGYRVFELTGADRSFRLVLSRRWHLAPSTPLLLVPLGGYDYVETPDDARGGDTDRDE